ncbi:MAG TPA: hypothetical protein VFO35_08885 [Steroidobacteraceae bacterium]|nr:hypothetical protein [Steroidobacteraceae bacterium]
MYTARIAGLACLLLGSAANANDDGPLEQNAQISLGAFFLDTDTTMRVDGETGRGTSVNFGEDLGFRDQDRFRVDGFWRFAARHKVRFMYFKNTLTAGRTIDETIEFRDVTYPVNVRLDAEFETEIVEAAYEYAFVRREGFELAATAGLHLIRFSAALTGEGTSPGGGGSGRLRSEARGDGPLPVLGLRTLWNIGGDWYLDAHAQFLAISVDNYDGHVSDYKVAVLWQPLRHVGVGVAYNDFRTRLDADEKRFEGQLRFEYSGPLAFVTVAF